MTGRVHSGTFIERSLVHQSCLESRRSLTSGRFFLQLVDEATNTCNVLYLTEVKDAFWPIYTYVADFHSQLYEWPVVLGWITLLLWRSWLTYMEPCKTKKLGMGRDLSQEGWNYSIQHTIAIIAHTGETLLEHSGGERMGGLQCQLLLKFPEECPSGCRWRGRVLAMGVGEAVG